MFPLQKLSEDTEGEWGVGYTGKRYKMFGKHKENVTDQGACAENRHGGAPCKGLHHIDKWGCRHYAASVSAEQEKSQKDGELFGETEG